MDVAQVEATSEVAITGRATPEVEVVAEVEVEEVGAVDTEAVDMEAADTETVETLATPLGNSFSFVCVRHLVVSV